MFKESGNIEREQKGIKEIEFTSEDGLVIYREKYEGGGEGVWERTGVSTADKKGILRVRQELEERYGADKIG